MEFDMIHDFLLDFQHLIIQQIQVGLSTYAAWIFFMQKGKGIPFSRGFPS